MRQLTLFDIDQLEGRCPHCGHKARLPAFVPAHQIYKLREPTRRVWNAAGFRFQYGLELMGPTEIAGRLDTTRQAVAYHLSVLVSEGLVKRVPQNKYRRQRYLYTGTLSK